MNSVSPVSVTVIESRSAWKHARNEMRSIQVSRSSSHGSQPARPCVQSASFEASNTAQCNKHLAPVDLDCVRVAACLGVQPSGTLIEMNRVGKPGKIAAGFVLVPAVSVQLRQAVLRWNQERLGVAEDTNLTDQTGILICNKIPEACAERANAMRKENNIQSKRGIGQGSYACAAQIGRSQQPRNHLRRSGW